MKVKLEYLDRVDFVDWMEKNNFTLVIKEYSSGLDYDNVQSLYIASVTPDATYSITIKGITHHVTAKTEVIKLEL